MWHDIYIYLLYFNLDPLAHVDTLDCQWRGDVESWDGVYAQISFQSLQRATHVLINA